MTPPLPVDYVADDYYGEHMLDSFYGEGNNNKKSSTVASVEDTLQFQPESPEPVDESEDTDDSSAWKSKHSGGHTGGAQRSR